MAPSNQIPHQAVTPGRSILKRRITIGTSGIEPETRVKTRHLPLVVYAVAALEANQGDKRKRYYVPAQVRANRPLAVTPGGRTSHIEGIIQKPLAGCLWLRILL